MRSAPRLTILAAAVSLLLGVSACGAPTAPTGGTDDAGDDAAVTVPETPSEAVTLNILDVAGNLQLTQPMIENFVAAHPEIVSDVTFETGTAPDMPGKVKAQQDANRVQIDLILTGTDGLASGLSQGLFLPIAADHADRLTNMDNYLEPAAQMQTLAEDQGVVITYYPSGPLLEYNPNAVTDPPSTPDELLAWAAANPGKFGYARPSNSGPARTFLMGLPYLLGDTDPQDPVNGWEKTWAFLKELDQHIDYYPTGTSPTMQNLGNGTWDMIATTTGWDINPRALGTVPKDFQVAAFDNFTWVTDAHYAVVPKGVSADKQAAVLQLIQFMLTPEQNAIAYDTGYFYPGPCVEGATLEMAPQESQDVIAEYGRPEYADLIASNDTALPLPADAMVEAYDIWDREIGANKTQ
ncbi:MAG: extracellular solute-binding protein [Propionibacteriaceae bacterium]|nr:extracellular solute-binding protein [Propionibacteriaceae bacterium]